MKIIALIPAAGVGSRASRAGATQAKQYQEIQRQPMLLHTVQALLKDPRISSVHIGVSPEDQIIDQLDFKQKVNIYHTGGATRAQTVFNTLKAIKKELIHDQDVWVLVHDAARPGLSSTVLKQLIDTCLQEKQGGILALPVADTVKQAKRKTATQVQYIEKTIARTNLWLAQTPQMFLLTQLLEALEMVLNGSFKQQQPQFEITDEASAMEAMGHKVLLVPGHYENLKVTWPNDFELMEKLLCQ